MKNSVLILIILIVTIIFICIPFDFLKNKENNIELEPVIENVKSEVVYKSKIDELLSGDWQAKLTFPDWKGYVDDTLAMNSMYSFDGFKNQGKIYLSVDNKINSFDLFINNKKIDTSDLKGGIYELDISNITKNGTNTMQVSSIVPNNINNAITAHIPYPTVINGKLEDVNMSEEPFKLINDIISSDVKNGFSSAQLAVIKDGRLVYQNAWGYTNAYNEDGSPIENGINVTNDTMYDLASNTKMYAAAYGIQYLMDKGQINLDDRIVDLIGNEFVDNTLEIKFSSFGGNYPGIEKIKKWKSQITIKDVLMHQAGFPDSGHYHNEFFDTVNQGLNNNVNNILYVENANREKTLKEGIFKTPLIYEPKTKTLYSDIDYMLLGLIIEKITGKDLDVFLKDTFWKPMDLERITYNPLKNGFDKNDCAATELNGNTRNGLVNFPNIRTATVQGEVHDEEAYYTMDGISGHAGIFASATDLAKLASIMLTGGYGNNRFFSKNIRDLFASPQSYSTINYGIGWYREADDNRVWYFGTQSPESTIGHQGWTGTLTMVDFENNMVVVFLTNAINTPILSKSNLDSANDFAGRYYTTATLGFVPQIIYMGMDNDGADLSEALDSLKNDFINEKQKLVNSKKAKMDGKLSESHPIMKAKKALEDIGL